ncbi:MAG: ATP-binding protein [Vicinamibacterales bacterium]
MKRASMFSSLTNRIFLGGALLVILSIAAAIYRVNVTVSSQAERELRRELAEAGDVVDEVRTIYFEHFLVEARLLADLPKLRALLTTDAATVREPAHQYREQIDSDVLIMTGPEGGVLAASGLNHEAIDAAAHAAIGSARAGQERTWFWPQAGAVLQMASLPVWIEIVPGAPELLGTLSVGFRLDGQTAARFRKLTNSEVAFAHGGRVLASTVDSGSHAVLEAALRDGRDSVRLGAEDYLLLKRPLPAGDTGSGGEPPQAVLLRSRGDLERLLERVHRDLAVSAVLAVLAATLLAYGIARTVTRPLRALSATMGEMAETGDLTRQAPARGRWDDEDARLLGSTFNALTSSIARFQREAAQRERLSSLGRLSTVIAHEVRNPLMIIKSALHALRGPQADPADVRAAAADIEEEVTRLNRIVSDVLDFARPISFQLSSTNVNEICRDAARAVSRPGAAPVTLKLDDAIPAVITDGERLRQTLINILSNAQDAAAGDGAIELSTAGVASGIALAVRDTGPGISREALPHIFEPYFTTKRTGSGVGLAIAKNIVEGLGGRISADSGQTAGAGTTITIQLPAAAGHAGAEARWKGDPTV